MKRVHQGKEVNRARGRLQNLLDRSDSSGTDDEFSSEPPEIFDKEFEEQFKRETSDWKLIKNIPKLPASRRRDNADYEFDDHRSYVLKLYDRSVDLGLFSPDSALYPVCRAWMKNDPNNLDIRGKPVSPPPVRDIGSLLGHTDDELAEDIRPVYSLPPPQKPPQDRRGMTYDPRIPIPARANREAVEASIEDPEPTISGQDLLRDHLAHWWNVRQKWCAGSRQRENRYENSMRILRRMYDRSSANVSPC